MDGAPCADRPRQPYVDSSTSPILEPRWDLTQTAVVLLLKLLLLTLLSMKIMMPLRMAADAQMCIVHMHSFTSAYFEENSSPNGEITKKGNN